MPEGGGRGRLLARRARAHACSSRRRRLCSRPSSFSSLLGHDCAKRTLVQGGMLAADLAPRPFSLAPALPPPPPPTQMTGSSVIIVCTEEHAEHYAQQLKRQQIYAKIEQE